jgi:hypothetical protein
MSTLTTTSGFAPAASDTASTRKPLWRRALDAVVHARQRRAEREVARYLANHGGLLTDDMERQIMHRLTEQRL